MPIIYTFCLNTDVNIQNNYFTVVHLLLLSSHLLQATVCIIKSSMSQHNTSYVIYHGILCHDISYVTTIAASLVTSLQIVNDSPILNIQ